MNKTRIRKLKAAYRKRFGRAPYKTRWDESGPGTYWTSEWRRVKKLWLREHLSP